MRATTVTDIFVLGVIFGAVVWIVSIVLGKFTAASDAAAILGVIFPSMAAIGAAAFGVSLAVQAKAATEEAKAEKTIAENKLSAKIEIGKRIDSLLKDLNVADSFDQIRNISQIPEGTSMAEFYDSSGKKLPMQININNLSQTQSKIDQISVLAKQLSSE